MTDGYRNPSGVDASALYDPDVIGDGYNATFLKRSDGSTLKYALASYGIPGSTLEFRDSGGADVGPKWAAIGTAHYSIAGLQGNSYSVAGAASGVSGQPGASVNCSIAFNNTGAYSLTATVIASGGGSGTIAGFPASGTWLPSGWTVADTQIQFGYNETILEAGAASKTNPAPTYTSLSTSQAFLMSAACAATSPNGNGSLLAMTVLLKQVSTGTVITTTFNVTCDAASGV